MSQKEGPPILESVGTSPRREKTKVSEHKCTVQGSEGEALVTRLVACPDTLHPGLNRNCVLKDPT